MPYENGKLALRQENKLLAILLEATNDYANSLDQDSLGAFIARDWAGSFEKLQVLNAKLLAEEDPDAFKTTFDDEKELLRRFLKVTQKTGFGKSWEELFLKDIQIADRLLSD
jgi:hypothetical protein